VNRGFDFGFTGVYAEAFTRESVFAALRERRTFGTTGDRIIVDFRLNEHAIGSAIHPGNHGAARTLIGTVSITGTDGIVAIDLVRTGKTVRTWEPGTPNVALTWEETARDRAAGERDYYYVAIRQANDEMAWASPVFVCWE